MRRCFVGAVEEQERAAGAGMLSCYDQSVFQARKATGELRAPVRGKKRIGRSGPCGQIATSSLVLQIVPSIFAADFMRLGEEMQRVEKAGAQMIHVDIMDGHFVPNFTMGTPITESLRKFTRLKLDHHLMIEDPDTYAPGFHQSGSRLRKCSLRGVPESGSDAAHDQGSRRAGRRGDQSRDPIPSCLETCSISSITFWS